MFIRRIYLLCVYSQKPRLDPPSVAANLNIKMFLAAYMIRYRPHLVFEYDDTTAKNLFTKARSLIAYTDTMVAKIDARDSLVGNGKSWATTFPTVIEAYKEAFTAWKKPDETRLVTRIRHAVVALMQAQNQLPPDEPADSLVRMEIVTQLTRMREQLRRIAGQAGIAQLDADLAQINLGPASGN